MIARHSEKHWGRSSHTSPNCWSAGMKEFAQAGEKFSYQHSLMVLSLCAQVKCTDKHQGTAHNMLQNWEQNGGNKEELLC